MTYEMSIDARMYWERQLNGPCHELAKKLLDRADGISEDPSVKHKRICRKIREMGIKPAPRYIRMRDGNGEIYHVEDESFEEKYDL